MRRSLILLTVLSILAACDSTYTPQAPDLRGTHEALGLSLQRTAEAQEQIQASATMAAAATDQASRERVTQIAFEITATAVARENAAQDATSTSIARLVAEATADSDRLTKTAYPPTATWQAFETTKQAVDLELAQRRLENQRYSQQFWAWVADYGEITAWVFVVILSVSLIGFLFYAIAFVGLPTWWRKNNTVERKDGGLTFFDYFKGTWSAANVDRHAGAVLELGPDGSKSTGYSPDPGLHMLWMQQQAMIEALRAMAMSGANDFRRPSVKLVEPLIEQAQAPQLAAGQLPSVAPWSIVESWRGPGFSIGVDETLRPVIVNPETTPHLLVAGTSGSGKTRGILLPVVVQALNNGWNVVLVNDRAADFAAVRSHPALSNPSKDNESKVEMVERVAAEVRRRDQVLRDASATTWGRMDRPGAPLMLVVDEIVSFAWSLRSTTPDLARRLWSAIITITSEGRKMAIMFVGATTDPTYRTLGKEGLTMRENCGRVAMKMKNAAQSRAILDEPSAETLGRFEFVAALGFGEQVRGRAFSPEDHQLLHSIRRPVVEELSPLELPEPKVQEENRLADREIEDMILMWRMDGVSYNEICRRLGWAIGGNNLYKVQEIERQAKARADNNNYKDTDNGL